MATEDEQLMTVAELADRWQQSTSAIHRKLASGALHGIDINPGGQRRRWRIRVSEVERIETASPA